MQHAVEANVLVQLENLRGHPCVAEALAKDRLTLHGWVYDIATGEIRAYTTSNGNSSRRCERRLQLFDVVWPTARPNYLFRV